MDGRDCISLARDTVFVSTVYGVARTYTHELAGVFPLTVLALFIAICVQSVRRRHAVLDVVTVTTGITLRIAAMIATKFEFELLLASCVVMSCIQSDVATRKAGETRFIATVLGIAWGRGPEWLTIAAAMVFLATTATLTAGAWLLHAPPTQTGPEEQKASGRAATQANALKGVIHVACVALLYPVHIATITNTCLGLAVFQASARHGRRRTPRHGATVNASIAVGAGTLAGALTPQTTDTIYITTCALIGFFVMPWYIGKWSGDPGSQQGGRAATLVGLLMTFAGGFDIRCTAAAVLSAALAALFALEAKTEHVNGPESIAPSHPHTLSAIARSRATYAQTEPMDAGEDTRIFSVGEHDGMAGEIDMDDEEDVLRDSGKDNSQHEESSSELP